MARGCDCGRPVRLVCSDSATYHSMADGMTCVFDAHRRQAKASMASSQHQPETITTVRQTVRPRHISSVSTSQPHTPQPPNFTPPHHPHAPTPPLPPRPQERSAWPTAWKASSARARRPRRPTWSRKPLQVRLASQVAVMCRDSIVFFVRSRPGFWLSPVLPCLASSSASPESLS